jgi:hypothetical protein
VHPGLGLVHVVRAQLQVVLGVGLEGPVSGDRHHRELRVQAEIRKRARGDGDAAELGRGRARPHALQQPAPDALAVAGRRHGQPTKLLHAPEPHRAGKAHDPLLVLAHPEAPALLRDEEVHERPLQLPMALELRLVEPAGGPRTHPATGLAKGLFEEGKGRAEVRPPPLAEAGLGHRSASLPAWSSR